ncbi:hypothetical protein BUZ14_08300 [Staphylococcus gallinarum]|uniref:PepSY domain-containing protein n=1 Tax=Staphylococcus gallinarum TaxID=1293 RepID=A0A3A0VIT2_STAGA|nr:PepSY domain-containing protein [Staphylococcus gallinarum]RIP34040.1 hypothetical protein BUZ14_08300 [Staphylococcus gallinarum]
MLNKKNLFIIIFILLTSIVAVCLAYNTRKNQQYLNPEKVIKEVRTYFMNVVGSYILNETIHYSHNGNDVVVYQGGITTQHNGNIAYYDFFVNASTGEIIDIIECTK